VLTKLYFSSKLFYQFFLKQKNNDLTHSIQNYDLLLKENLLRVIFREQLIMEFSLVGRSNEAFILINTSQYQTHFLFYAQIDFYIYSLTIY
jgi:hypothetical protein